MSMAALLGATRDTLQALLGHADGSVCDLQVDGQPPPFAGAYYVAIHQGDVRNQDTNSLSLDELFGLYVTITYRTDTLPADVRGSNLLIGSPDGGSTPSINALAQSIKVALHMAYGVIDKAGGTTGGGHTWAGGNAYSIAGTAEGFVEPLKFVSQTRPEPKGPAWFGGQGVDNAMSGVTIMLTFIEARRLQTLESMS